MGETVTIKDVLAVIDKMSQETQAMFEKTDKQIAETRAMFKESDLEMKAMLKETDKQVKASHKRISELGGRLGEIIEYIVSPHLEKKFGR
ncbi:MAG: hypothetical protein LBU25_05160 [Treponema sp.]|jgi:Na+/phosphate symporter|nr:hypothetical protein [Treponema sp.]